jgi:hypothetical protein
MGEKGGYACAVLAGGIFWPEHNDITYLLLLGIRDDCTTPKSDAA